MKFKEVVWELKTVIMPLLLIMLVSMILWAIGHNDAASMLSTMGTGVVMLGNLVYTVVIDSRKRWPNASTWQRYVNIITFRSD